MDGHGIHMYHNASIMASPTYSPDHSNILSYSIMSPSMLSGEHEIKTEPMHGMNNHHSYQVAHDSRSPSLDGEHEHGNGDHLHEMQTQQMIMRKMADRPSVVNIKTE